MSSVNVVIPTIPRRSRMLGRAVASVAEQTHPADGITIVNDHAGAGAWATRNRGIYAAAATSPDWLAFLDDDDELLPHHLEHLLDVAGESGAGLVWAWFDVIGGTDPIPQFRGRPYDLEAPHTVPITFLVRTDVVLAAMRETGGYQADASGTGAFDVQDFPMFHAMARIGGTANDDEVTWLWHHHGRNTSGLPATIEHRPIDNAGEDLADGIRNRPQ